MKLFDRPMDNFHEIHKRSFVSEAFEVGEQAKEAQKLLQSTYEWANKASTKDMRTEEEQEADCNIDLLSSFTDLTPMTRKVTYYMMSLCLRTRPIMTLEMRRLDDESCEKLITLELLKKDLKKRKHDRNYDIRIANKALYHITSVDKILAHIPKEDGEKVEVGEDMVLTVRIHRPTKHIENKLRIKWKMIRHDQQFLVLGRNKLSDLRDAIKCPEDYVDLNVDPYNPYTFMLPDAPKKIFKEEFPSSFIFIHDTAYNDMRHPKSLDLSEPLRRWSRLEETTGVEEIKCGRMEDTYINDLTLRLGRPYLFNHANRCEHVIVFSMARQVEAEDPKPLSMYPILTHVTIKRPKMCQMCREYVSNFMISDTDMVPLVPYFACKDCYVIYFFDKNSSKRGNYTAHYIVDRTSVL